jgi:hypothetical protein
LAANEAITSHFVTIVKFKRTLWLNMNGDIGIGQLPFNLAFNFVAELVSLFNGHIVPDDEVKVNVSVLASLPRPNLMGVDETLRVILEDASDNAFLG